GSIVSSSTAPAPTRRRPPACARSVSAIESRSSTLGRGPSATSRRSRFRRSSRSAPLRRPRPGRSTSACSTRANDAIIRGVPERHDLALINGRAVLPGDVVERVNIGVRDGKIATLTGGALDAEETIDVEGLTVLPGIIDEHFHVFRGYGWETYSGATRAAAK